MWREVGERSKGWQFGKLKQARLIHRDFPVAQLVKNLPAMQETQVRSLGGEDPLEKEMATHSSSFAWRIPWREEPGSLQPWGHKSQTWLSDYTTTTSLIHNRSVGVKFPKADKGFHTAPKAKKMPRKHRLRFLLLSVEK